MDNEIRFESENVQKINDCLVAYRNEDKTSYRLTLELDDMSDDLKEYLFDFGLAGILEKHLVKILNDSTKGYIKWRAENSNGTWTKECLKFNKDV